MPSITAWTRLEPRARTAELGTALQARVHDPLWLLARQWQLGEFTGEDAAAPASVRVRVDTASITSCELGVNGTKRNYDASSPLQAVVEHEPTWGANIALSAETGLHFLRLLDQRGLSRYRSAFLQRYPLSLDKVALGILDPQSRASVRVLVGRAPDGYSLIALFESVIAYKQFPSELGIRSEDVSDVLSLGLILAGWWNELYSGGQPNLLNNPRFGEAGQNGVLSEFASTGTGPAPANGWFLYNNTPALTRSQIVTSNFPGGGDMMIHVDTQGKENGLRQWFLPVNTGPSRAIASAWVFVVRGRVYIGAGNGGGIGKDAKSSATNRWELLQAPCSMPPANGFIVYAAEDGGAEFYVASASVWAWPTQASSASNLLPHPFEAVGPRGPLTTFTGVGPVSGDAAAAMFWGVYNTNDGTTTTELLPNTGPAGERNMLRVGTTAAGNGIVRCFLTLNTGPARAVASAWVLVERGQIQIGIGNGGKISKWTRSATNNQWQRLIVDNVDSPVNQLNIYSASTDGADFYVADILIQSNESFALSEVKGDATNYLNNPMFDGVVGSSTTFEVSGRSAAAAAWSVWRNTPTSLDTELTSSTFPFAPGESTTMIRVSTAGLGNGLVQAFCMSNTGPSEVVGSAWIYVLRGRVRIGTGNSGSTVEDARSSRTNQWEFLSAPNGVAPANEFVIYSATEDGAEFYVASASVTEVQSSLSSAADSAAWLDERMEYRFSLSAAGSRTEVVLSSPEYDGNGLDWYDFDLDSLRQLPGDSCLPEAQTLVPHVLHYPGMPAPRWWEFEDARINFGKLQTEPGDLARLLLVEYATVCSNDWFRIPVELPVGTLAQVTSLVVTDTFGERTLISEAGAGENQQRVGDWHLFCLSTSRAPGTNSSGLFLPPTLPAHLESGAVEEVRFLRDEMANMAWAVERAVESKTGRPIDRQQLFEEERRRQPASPPAASSSTLAYRLETEVPEHWCPLVPALVRRGRLRRASSNFLLNGDFQLEGVGGPSPIVTYPNWVGASAAKNWHVFNNERQEGVFTKTELVPSTFPGGTGSMMHLVTTGNCNGIVQVFLPYNTGPQQVFASAWVFVIRGAILIGTGNGGNICLDAISSTTNRWDCLQGLNTVSPANEFIIYSASQGGAEVYVASASVEVTSKSILDLRVATQSPSGQILQRGADLQIFQEEVPREGITVTRTWRYARWSDGCTHVWRARSKLPGRGEGSSGLRFDIAEPRRRPG